MDAAMGVWASQGFGSKVELEPCDNPRGELCGTVIWLWDAFEEDGEQKTDQRNPAADKRSNPIVGTRILSGFRRVKNGECPTLFRHAGVNFLQQIRNIKGAVGIVSFG